MKKSSDLKSESPVHEKTYDRIKRLATDKGLSLQEVCRHARVDRQSLEHWKDEDPKTIQTMHALEDAIAMLPAKVKKESEVKHV